MAPQRKGNDYLKRLPPEFYRGLACVSWTMAIQDRKVGWLSPLFHFRLRELLTHAMFRYGICCPMYCLMPDHMHLLWLGLMQESDQRRGMRFFRKALNPVLKAVNCRLQDQPYDHVLRDDERQPAAFQNIAQYIAQNPERKELVPVNGFWNYEFTGCLVPGYPDLNPFQTGYWDMPDRLCSHMRKNGLIQTGQSEAES